MNWLRNQQSWDLDLKNKLGEREGEAEENNMIAKSEGSFSGEYSEVKLRKLGILSLFGKGGVWILMHKS